MLKQTLFNQQDVPELKSNTMFYCWWLFSCFVVVWMHQLFHWQGQCPLFCLFWWIHLEEEQMQNVSWDAMLSRELYRNHNFKLWQVHSRQKGMSELCCWIHIEGREMHSTSKFRIISCFVCLYFHFFNHLFCSLKNTNKQTNISLFLLFILIERKTNISFFLDISFKSTTIIIITEVVLKWNLHNLQV